VREAWLALQRTDAARAGGRLVAKRTVQVGQRVAAGTPLMTVVALHQLWVDANFKESAAAARMRIGQPVTLEADVYGSQVEYTAAWPAWAPAPARPSRCCRRRTPPATGSRWCSACRCASRWTTAELAEHPLRVGLSMLVTVDTRPERQALADAAQRAALAQHPVFDAQTRRAEAEVQPASSPPCRPQGICRCACREPSPPTCAGPPGDEPPPPLAPTARRCRAARALLGTLALSLATFMNVLDSSIANVSMPAIAGDLGVSPAQGTWVITSFAVANAISVPLTGWLTQRFGAGAPVREQRAAVRAGVLAVRPGAQLEMLIAARAAGPGGRADDSAVADAAAGQLPAGQGRHRAGAVGHDHAGGAGGGPLLGGWITDNVSWPWIFYINVPVGLLAAVLTWGIYRKRETRHAASCRSTPSAWRCWCCGSARCS
jgi:hypothetical protein